MNHKKESITKLINTKNRNYNELQIYLCSRHSVHTGCNQCQISSRADALDDRDSLQTCLPNTQVVFASPPPMKTNSLLQLMCSPKLPQPQFVISTLCVKSCPGHIHSLFAVQNAKSYGKRNGQLTSSTVRPLSDIIGMVTHVNCTGRPMSFWANLSTKPRSRSDLWCFDPPNINRNRLNNHPQVFSKPYVSICVPDT